MKYINRLTITALLLVGLATSCKDDEVALPNGIVVDKEEITIGPEGGAETVEVASALRWAAGVSRPWIAVSPANGQGESVCKLVIDSTLENTSRTAQIRFLLEGGESKLIEVTQMGFGKQIILKEREIEIESSAYYDNRYFESVISTNINFRIDEITYSFAEEESMPDVDKAEFEEERMGWITKPAAEKLEVNLDRKARPRTLKAKFNWAMNTTPYTRVAKIRFTPQNSDEDKLIGEDGNPLADNAVVLTIRQKPALRITDDRAGDSLAIITINEKLRSAVHFETSENMRNWDNVKLWEATDKNKPSDEAVGRVRSVRFMLIDLKDGDELPKEIRHLKYLESFSIQSNPNSHLRTVSLGKEICKLEYLKHLNVFAYGLAELPDNFTELGNSLETCFLESNNFTNLTTLTDVINQTNFPNLKALSFSGCRCTDTLKDLTQAPRGIQNGKPIGLYANFDNADDKNALVRLLTWDNLLYLSLTYNFFEGSLPTDEDMENALRTAGKPLHYTDQDFFTKEELAAQPGIFETKLSKDTCRWLLTNDNSVTYQGNDNVAYTAKGQEVLRVMPRTRSLRISLNFWNGILPKWMLFHPYFAEWLPTAFIFNQEFTGKNTSGGAVGFTNAKPDNFDFGYYYGTEEPSGLTVPGVAYPLYYRRFVADTTYGD